MMRIGLAAAGVYCSVYGGISMLRALPEAALFEFFTAPVSRPGLGFSLCGVALLLRAFRLNTGSVFAGLALEVLAICQIASRTMGVAPEVASGAALITIGDSLCFLLTGIAIQFIGYRHAFRFRSAFVALCGSMVFGYGWISLSNTLAGLSNQSIDRGIGFIILGGYLVTAAWNDPIRSLRPLWFNAAIGLGSLTANLVLWHGLAQIGPGEQNAQVFAAAVLYAGFLAVMSLTVATHFAQAAHLKAAGMTQLNQGLLEEISRRTQVEASLDQQIKQLASLKRIDTAILAEDLPKALEVVAEEAVKTLGAASAAIHVAEADEQDDYCAAVAGDAGPLNHALRLAPSAEVWKQAIQSHEPVLLHSISFSVTDGVEENNRDYQAIPLLSKGKLLGLIELTCEAGAHATSEHKDFIEALTGQTCIALEHTMYLQALENSNEELLEAYDATLSGWALALELRDSETQDHTVRVTEGTMVLARQFNLTEEELLHIRRGALLHDIGKIGIPDAILHKAGPLDEEEWRLMKQHPLLAYDLLKDIAYLQPALDIPHCHHEKWDGSGYPAGLSGTDIPFAARMFAVIDVWDALASDRPYRAGWRLDKIKKHISSLSGSHFDPQVVDAFLELLESECEIGKPSELAV